MSVNIRFPKITALSEREQLAQIKSYLHQLVEQLNYVLPNLSTGTGAGQTVSVQGTEISYYELRTMIIRQAEQLRDQFNQLAAELDSKYIKSEDIATIATEAANKLRFTIDEETGILYYEVIEEEDEVPGEEEPGDENTENEAEEQ